MRKLIMWNMLTLDGFFEGPDKGQIDWFRSDKELEEYILNSQRSVGAFVFGRVTYEGMASYWPSADGPIARFMNSVPKIVFSRTLERAEWNNTRLVKNNVPDEIRRLKQQPGGNIFVVGSANLITTLMQHHLIDEYRLGINPVILGHGIPLFKYNPERLDLKLLESKSIKSGLVILHYQPA